jgi:UDP-2,3-diacylglucosamine hydrolase
MLRAIFLSDTHLKNEREPGYERVLRFLEELDGCIDHLFIVGDFFDFWFCRKGALFPSFKRPIDEILKLARKGVKVGIFEGNHDFMMKPFFRGMPIEIYSEWADFVLDGRRFLVSHGDTIDTSNIRYLTLRKILRSGFFYYVQKRIPTRLLWKIADACSRTSKGLTLESERLLAEKMEKFSLKKFEDGYDAVVVGHCHLPILKEYNVKGRKKTFAALGDWISHFTYLDFDGKTFQLVTYT